MDHAADRDYVADLSRWEDSGAVWEVVADTGKGLTIALLRCDGGEEADRFTSDDPRLRAFVEKRSPNRGRSGQDGRR